MQAMDSLINPTILGLPGDYLGGPGGYVQFPPGTSDYNTTGFLPRLSAYLSSNPNTSFEWVIVLGGANDITASCYRGDKKYIDNDSDQLQKIASLALTRSKKVLLLPTFISPQFQYGACKAEYDRFYTIFADTAKTLKSTNPERIFTANTTSLIRDFSNSLFIDSLHLNQEGNKRLAAGILPLTPRSEEKPSQEKEKSKNSEWTASLSNLSCTFLLAIVLLLGN